MAVGYTNTTTDGQEADMYDASRTMESDSFFRHIDRDWVEDEDGSVESPSGWFAAVTIDESFRAAHEFEVPASVEDGDYLVQIDSNGTVWAWAEDGNHPFLAEYRAELEEEYGLWLDQD